MTLSVVCQAPANQPVVTINGRSYYPSNGVVVVPMPDAMVAAQQVGRVIQWQGATADRPVYNPNGGINGGLPTLSMLDTTISSMIYVSNVGAAPVVWVNAAGSVV